jgi:hypothetical protein
MWNNSAINANETSAQNFTAFMNNAKSSVTSTSTGTGTGISTSASTPSVTQSSSAVSIHFGETTAALMVIALLFLVL